MANYKYQHYLPSGHQKFFSCARDKRGFVCKYDKKKNILYSFLQNPKNHGGINHLYSYPNSLVSCEEQMTFLEQKYFSNDGQFIDAINKLIKSAEISENEVYQITKYIANINNRHPAILEFTKKDVTQSALKVTLGNDSNLIDLFTLKGVEFVPESNDDFLKVSTLLDMLRSIEDNLHELCNISMNILVSDDAEFILSDSPFVGINDELSLIDTTSLSSDNNYYLPLSKNICAHLNGEGQNLNYYPVNEEFVDRINRLQIYSAKKFVIGSSVEVLQASLKQCEINYELKGHSTLKPK